MLLWSANNSSQQAIAQNKFQPYLLTKAILIAGHFPPISKYPVVNNFLQKAVLVEETYKPFQTGHLSVRFAFCYIWGTELDTENNNGCD